MLDCTVDLFKLDPSRVDLYAVDLPAFEPPISALVLCDENVSALQLPRLHGLLEC